MVLFRVLKEALFLHASNTKLFAALYFIVALFFAPLLAWHCFGLMPLILHIVDLYKLGSQIPADTVLNCTVTAALFVLAFIAIVASLTVVTMYAATATYIGETSLSLGDLFRKVKATARGPAITIAIAYAVYIVYAAVLGALVYLALTLGKYSWVWPVLFWILAVVFFFKYLFVLALFSVGVALSTVEHQFYAVSAVKKSWSVLRSKKLTAVAVVLLFLITDRIFGLIYIKAVGGSYYDHQVLLAVVLDTIYVLFLAGFFLYLNNIVAVLFFVASGPSEAAGIYSSLTAGAVA